jgi:diguanylate cyclase (GGDEF)-like protein
VARIGGDEFAVLLPHASAEQGQTIANDIRDLINKYKIGLDDGEVNLSASIGVVQIDRDSPNDEDVIADADRFMYQEKQRVTRT